MAAKQYIVRFTYADYRVKGYEQFGASRSLKAKFDSKKLAWSWIRDVEEHDKANDSVLLCDVVVLEDSKAIFQADYHRQSTAWLYSKIDCRGGVWRYIR